MVTTLQTQGLTALNAALGIRFDVSPAWKFYVEVLGVLVAEFQECSGLTMERHVEHIKEGGTNDFEWLLPGQISYGNITLKKGITYNRELWRWFRWGMLDGQIWGFNTLPGAAAAISLLKTQGIIVPMGTSISIILGTVDGKVAKHWDLIGAIPVKWIGPEMTAGSDQAAIETLEVAHQGIDLSLEMMTPMAGFFASDDSADLSSPPPHEGPANAYYDLQTGGRLEEQDPDKGFAVLKPRAPGEDIVFDEADKISKGFWDMADIAPETEDEKKKREEKEAQDDKAFEDYWEMPGAG
jgi:phage tail-like protein